MKVYDSFCFFNELETLELRLNILNDYVDYFVLSESSVTHTGKPKPYYYEENKHMFEKFNHKIIHLKIEDTPEDFMNLPYINDPNTPDGVEVSKIHNYIKTQTDRFDKQTQIDYGRDFFQKESVRRGFINCDDDDIILFSDLDEIPNPDILKNISEWIEKSKFLSFNQNSYYYYFNLFKEDNWYGTKMCKYKDIKNYSLNELRAGKWFEIPNGGWHFSFMGGTERVRYKIQSYCHQEMNNDRVISNIENNIKNGIDPFFRGKLNRVLLDESFPKYLLDNRRKYENMILK